MTEETQKPEQGGGTFINVKAKAALPVVRAASDFREVATSGASASTLKETLKKNEIGTLDE